MKKDISCVAIIILNWNKPDLTLDCLEKVKTLEHSDYKLKIVVVDNASSDDSVSMLSNLKFENADYKLITNDDNQGFSKGNNIGIKHAIDEDCEYLLLLNNDTEVDINLITELLKVAKSNPLVGIVSPKIYFAKGYEFHKDRYKSHELGKVIWAAGGNIDWKNVYGTNRGVDEVDNGQFDKVENVDFASGACVLIKRVVIEKIGLLNEKYYMYLEDLEYSLRAKNAGFEIKYIPKAVMWHKVSQSSKIGGELNDYFITRNRLLFAQRYASLRSKFAIMREAFRLLVGGRKWQRIGVRDYFIGRSGKGSWR